MRSETNLLKEKIKCASSLTEKIELLRNAYNCDECYIISAGPSFKEIDPHVLREKLKDKLVIAVKQTYNLLKEITDFHLLNPYNYQPYDYISNEPIICYTEIEGLNYKLPLLKSDLKFTIPLSECSKEKSLSVLRNFDDYLIENAHQRPFGPGIMHELGIYLPVLLGIKRVYVIGWDLGSTMSNKIERFYNKKNTNIIANYLIENRPNVYNKYLVPILNRYNYFLFLLGHNRVLNNPGVSKNEAAFIADSTWDLYKWYQKKNIDLFVISNISLLDKRIPRSQI